jgi:hypothetical protein
MSPSQSVAQSLSFASMAEQVCSVAKDMIDELSSLRRQNAASSPEVKSHIHVIRVECVDCDECFSAVFRPLD